MNQAIKTILIILAVVAGTWLAYTSLNKWYLTPRAELISGIRAANVKLADYRQARDDQKRINAELQAIVDRTLGGDLETVDHKLRTRLNRLAEHVQLQNVSVGTTSAAKPKESPAKLLFTRSISQRALRDEIDFVELEGWISGSGSFEQVLRLVDSIEAEPWIKRIDSLKLDPKENGARFEANIRLTTLFLPRRTPNPANAAAANAAGFDRYMALVQTNPFRVPPPPPPPPPVPQPQPMTDPTPPAAPPFPYEQWVLTGMAQSVAGHEIWLLNNQTHESRRLAVGESLQDVMFVAANGENAQFRLGEQRFLVPVGKNLSDRTPLNQ